MKATNNLMATSCGFRNDNHCFNPIYDSGTEKEVTHTALQGQLDQLCGQTQSDNPLYDTADTAPNNKDKHSRYFNLLISWTDERSKRFPRI